MRLDHLLSTEFSGRWFVVRRVAHASGMFPGSRVGVLVWKRSWASLVPLGPAGSGVNVLLGSRTATRIRFGCVRFSGCPWRDAVGLAGRGPGPVGARGGLRTG